MKTTWNPIFVVPMAVLLLAGCRGHDAAPAISASVSPDSGSGRNGTFAVTFSDPKGAAHIRSARVLINGAVDGREACYIFYDHSLNVFMLINDTGEGSIKLPKGGGGIENSQCRLEHAASTPSGDSKGFTIKLDLAFKPAFKGRKQLFLAVDDDEGNSPDLQSHGAWIVPNR